MIATAAVTAVEGELLEVKAVEMVAAVRAKADIE